MDSDGDVRWCRAGAYPVASTEVLSWVEVAGARVTVGAWFPVTLTTRSLPVVVFSHGLGGSSAGYPLLGHRLASHGYVVLQPQFGDAATNVASPLGVIPPDERAWMRDPQLRTAMLAMLFDPTQWVDRVRRVHAVIDSLGTQSYLPVRLRPERVIVAGHSYGAFTTQLLLGTRLHGAGLDDSWFRHSAVAGGILLSPQGSGDRGLTPRSWNEINSPLLVVTATLDRGPNGEGLSWRCELYHLAPAWPKFLAVVRGGDHLLGGIPFALETSASGAEIQDAIAAVTVAFADCVSGDRAAEDWLGSGPLPAIFDYVCEGATG